jgi:hypothetical protein
VLVALLAVHLADMGAFLATPVLGPLIGESAELPPSLAGLPTAIVSAGTLVSGPRTGALILRYGRYDAGRLHRLVTCSGPRRAAADVR